MLPYFLENSKPKFRITLYFSFVADKNGIKKRRQLGLTAESEVSCVKRQIRTG